MSINIGDFLNATREQRLSPKDALKNEASKGTYFFFSRMLQDFAERFKGGDKLYDFIQGETLNNAGLYNPNDRFSVSTQDTLTPISVYWAFLQSHYPIVKEAKALNAGDSTAFVNYVMSQEQACITDTMNKMENLLWDTPDRTVMEAEDQPEARSPYSIPAMVTRDGLAPSSTNGGVINGDWTTVETINPSTKTWWKNKVATYANATPFGIDTGIVSAFDEMFEKVQFEYPDPMKDYNETKSRQSQCIATSTEGRTMYKSALRSLNDRMSALVDPKVSGPQYEGVPIKRVSTLDDAGWTAAQPDYFFLNLSELHPFFHTDTFMDEQITAPSHDHPNKHVVWKFTYYNLICRSRRRQGRISAA